jgi:DNA polymerase phi
MPGSCLPATTTSLSLYWGLASLESKERIESSNKLISSLETIDSPILTTEDLENVTPNLSYALKRLIKGLSSSRKAARQGFSLALSQVRFDVFFVDLLNSLKILATSLPGVSLDLVLDLILKHTEITGGLKGQV